MSLIRIRLRVMWFISGFLFCSGLVAFDAPSWNKRDGIGLFVIFALVLVSVISEEKRYKRRRNA